MSNGMNPHFPGWQRLCLRSHTSLCRSEEEKSHVGRRAACEGASIPAYVSPVDYSIYLLTVAKEKGAQCRS